jgi:hypothetical protein
MSLLAFQIHCRSKAQQMPKKVLKRFIKKILKSSGQLPPQNSPKKKRKPTIFMVGFD